MDTVRVIVAAGFAEEQRLLAQRIQTRRDV